ncbi:MAG: hypothetical protein ACYTGW_13205 [Planctomycetota bacterium]|jgi:hypothetical protein
MTSRVLALVHSWLVLDFFGDSRKSGQPGSSLTTTIFTQSFIGLLFAIVVVSEPPFENDVAYLAANLSLSTLMVGIGLLGDPQRYKRAFADEVLARTAPLSANALTLARVLHGSFHLCLVTVGMALPPAILAYWVCGEALWVVPAYLVFACLSAGIMAGCLAVFTRGVHLVLGPARAQLMVGTLKALLLGGGFLLMVVCLRHLEGTAADIPLGPGSTLAWPPYWAARFLNYPQANWMFLGYLLAACVVLYLLSSMMQTAALSRRTSKPTRRGWLAALDRSFAGDGTLLGATAFISTMLYRSAGFRARVLPLFGLPFAMVLLSFMEEGESQARRLLLGMTLQFPAIFLPFLVAFLPRSDHEQASWVFDQSPHVTPTLFRAASFIALTTHIIVPVHATALAAMIAFGELTLPTVLFTVALSVFSTAIAILVARLSVQKLQHMPFTVDESDSEAETDFRGLVGGAIVLALLGGGFAMIAQASMGILIAVLVALFAVHRIHSARRHAYA